MGKFSPVGDRGWGFHGSGHQFCHLITCEADDILIFSDQQKSGFGVRGGCGKRVSLLYHSWSTYSGNLVSPPKASF